MPSTIKNPEKQQIPEWWLTKEEWFARHKRKVVKLEEKKNAK